jgi:hypothetical protein
MLILDDAALARLCIAATNVPPDKREQWLSDIAALLEGRKPRSRKAINQAVYRKRDRRGEKSLRLCVNEWAVTSALIETEVLTENEALDRSRVEAALAQHLDAWAKEVHRQKTRYR